MNGLAILKVALRSKNKKTGEIIATYRTQDSCPTSCPFMNRGCYAEHGFPSSFAIADKYGGAEAKTIQKIIDEAPQKGLVRHHVSGDIMMNGEIDRSYLLELQRLAAERPDLNHLSYTHAWKEAKPEDFAWTMNASCETKEEIEEAIGMGYEAVVTVGSADDPLVGQAIAGKKVVICPEETHENVTCDSCRLCARSRKSIVAFVVHGAGKSKAKQALSDKHEAT